MSSPRASLLASFANLAFIPIITFSACNPFGGGEKPVPNHALDGLQPLALHEARDAQQRVMLSAGTFSIGPLPEGWSPIRMGPQTVYTDMATGGSLTFIAMHSATPMDGKKQGEVLQALGQKAHGAEKIMSMMGAQVGEPQLTKTPWGAQASFRTTGPMMRVATDFVAVDESDVVWLKIEGQTREGADPAGDTLKLLGSFKVASAPAAPTAPTTPPSPAPTTPTPAKQ